MLRVRKTQRPSFKQIENMVLNLKDLYGRRANIQTVAFGNKPVKYWISDGFSCYGWFDTWQELQQEYHKIIKAWRGV